MARSPTLMPASPPATVALGLALAAIAALALVISPLSLLAIVLVLCLVAAGELFRIARRRGVVPLPLAGFASIAAIVGAAYEGPDAMLSALPGIAAGTAGVCLVLLVFRNRIAGALGSVATTVAGALYVGVLGSFIVAMRQAANGFRVALAFALMTAANEVAGFAGARWIGRHPLAPAITPTMSWEGLATGTAGTLLAAAAAAAWLSPPLTTGRALVLAAVVAVAAPLGNLAEAALERDAGDDAAAGPATAHGGVLRRIDGALFAAPVFYLAYRAMIR